MNVLTMQYSDCKVNDMIFVRGKKYYKIEAVLYVDSKGEAGMFNAVNAETGELGWIDIDRKVEVIAHEEQFA